MASDTTTTAETTPETTRSFKSWVFEINDPDYKYPQAYGCLKGMFQALEQELNYLENEGDTTMDLKYLKPFLRRAAEVVDAVNNCKRSS